MLGHLVLAGPCRGWSQNRLWALLVASVLALINPNSAVLLCTCCSRATGASSTLLVLSVPSLPGVLCLIVTDCPDHGLNNHTVRFKWAYAFGSGLYGGRAKPTAEGGGIHTSSK